MRFWLGKISGLNIVMGKTPRLPIALQQAVMRSLRQSLERANQALKTRYPEPKLLYQQRGTAPYHAAGRAVSVPDNGFSAPDSHVQATGAASASRPAAGQWGDEAFCP